MTGSAVLIILLIALAGAFMLMAAWALLGKRGAMNERIQNRLMGVQQIQDYELGASLADIEKQRKAAKAQRQEDVRRRKAFSEIPMLDRRLESTPWAEKLSSQLRQVHIPITVTSFLLLCLGCGALGLLLVVVWNKGFTLAAPLAFLGLSIMPLLFVKAMVGARRRRFSSQFPDALDLLSSSVKSGQALNSAILNVAEEMPEPVSEEFKFMSDEMAFGVEMGDALRHLADRVGTQDARFFCTALLIQRETGGNLSEVLDGLQRTIRERFRILRQVKALTAQGRLSGWIVGLLPVALGFVIYGMSPEYMSDLFKPEARFMLYGAIVMEVVGMLAIRKIVNIKV